MCTGLILSELRRLYQSLLNKAESRESRRPIQIAADQGSAPQGMLRDDEYFNRSIAALEPYSPSQ